MRCAQPAGPHRDLRLHRGLVQHSAPSLSSRLHVSSQLRKAACFDPNPVTVHRSGQLHSRARHARGGRLQPGCLGRLQASRPQNGRLPGYQVKALQALPGWAWTRGGSLREAQLREGADGRFEGVSQPATSRSEHRHMLGARSQSHETNGTKAPAQDSTSGSPSPECLPLRLTPSWGSAVTERARTSRNGRHPGGTCRGGALQSATGTTSLASKRTKPDDRGSETQPGGGRPA